MHYMHRDRNNVLFHDLHVALFSNRQVRDELQSDLMQD
jgi:prepilin-type processing-associated H-X9-DG protein